MTSPIRTWKPERKFSKQPIVENRFHSTLLEDRLNYVSILSTDNDKILSHGSSHGANISLKAFSKHANDSKLEIQEHRKWKLRMLLLMLQMALLSHQDTTWGIRTGHLHTPSLSSV